MPRLQRSSRPVNVRRHPGHTPAAPKARRSPPVPMLAGIPAAAVVCPTCRHRWPISDGIDCPMCAVVVPTKRVSPPAPVPPVACPDCGEELADDGEGGMVCPDCVRFDLGAEPDVLPLYPRAVSAAVRRGG